MCQVGAAGGGMPPVQQAPTKVGGVEGGGVPPAKVDQQPSAVAGDAGAGAKLIGGGPGDLGSVLASLVDALKSVVAALSGGATAGGSLRGGPQLAPVLKDPSQRSMDGLLHTTSASGRPIAIVKEGDSFRLQQATGFDEAVYVDDKLLAFDANGRQVTEAELVRLNAGNPHSLYARAESGRSVFINRFPNGVMNIMPPTGQPERVSIDGRVQLFDARGHHTGTA